MEEEKYYLSLMKEFMRELLSNAEWTYLGDSNKSITRKYETTLIAQVTILESGQFIEAIAVTSGGDVETVVAAEDDNGTLVVLEHCWEPVKEEEE